MPNYCNNYLKVSGDTKELKKFLKKGITEETKSYHYIVDKTGEKELVWRMSNYTPTPEPLLRTISPARDCEWVNEWEVNSANKRIDEQPSNIAKLELELQTATGEDVNDLLDQLMEAKKPIAIPELIPCANGTEKDRKALIKKYGTDNWYDWNVANWGTKWDCSSSECGYQTDNKTYFSVGFDSAWCPPTNWFHKIVEMYPKLNFKLSYSETGCWFAGVMFSDEGLVCEEQGEPEYIDSDTGEVVTYDNDKDVYIDSKGNEIDSDNVTDQNPFDEWEAPWEEA
jgi:hypothetical protein